MAEVGSEIDVYVSVGTERIAVPVVVGLTLEAARAAIEDAGLVVGDVEEMPDPERPAGIVIESDPAAGVEIGPSIPVNLVVSSGPEEVLVPLVTNLSERDAISALTAAGLLFTVNEEYHQTVPEDFVIRQDPVAGAQAFLGDTVLLVVSLGREPVEVPDLSGMTPQEAANALTAVNLVLNVSNTTQPVTDQGQDGRVVSQIPSPGTTADQGDTVTVVLGEFTPPPTTTTTTTIPDTTTSAP
jgi:serine/threonine-protein kinase